SPSSSASSRWSPASASSPKPGASVSTRRPSSRPPARRPPPGRSLAPNPRGRNRMASLVVLALIAAIGLGALGVGIFGRGGSATPTPQNNAVPVTDQSTPIPTQPPQKVKIPVRGGRYTEAVVGGVPTAINPLLPDTETDPNVTSLIFSGLSKLDG